jgi:hypothetical protein
MVSLLEQDLDQKFVDRKNDKKFVKKRCTNEKTSMLAVLPIYRMGTLGYTMDTSNACD